MAARDLTNAKVFNITVLCVCNTKLVLELGRLNTLAEPVAKNKEQTVLCPIKPFWVPSRLYCQELEYTGWRNSWLHPVTPSRGNCLQGTFAGHRTHGNITAGGHMEGSQLRLQCKHTAFYCTLQILSCYYCLECFYVCLFVLTNQRFVAALSCSISAIGQQHWLISCLLRHILIILTVFQTFSPWLYLLRWPVVSDLWCYYCNCPEAPPVALPRKTGNLITRC